MIEHFLFPSSKMSRFQPPDTTDEAYTIHQIIGRRPTERGLQYLIEWEMDDGSYEVSPELASFLEYTDFDTWNPWLDEFDEQYPNSEAVIGDWTGF